MLITKSFSSISSMTLVGAVLIGVVALLPGCASSPPVPDRQARPPAHRDEPARPRVKPDDEVSRGDQMQRPSKPDFNRALALANQLLPPAIRDRQGWAKDIATSMTALSIPAEPRKVCAIAAIIEQESGWQADPVVQNLPDIARREMDRKLDSYMIPSAVLDVALRTESANGQTYAQRIKKLRTERELSQLYEEMISEVPQGQRLFGGMNPVRTGGPMQVSVGFAAKTMKERRYPWRNPGSPREETFSRRGGVYFGTAMLLDYPVSYNRMIYRFADYNAGRYASRNAAFQRVVAMLAKTDLAPDGDLLRYKDGEAAGTSQTERALWAIDGLDLRKYAIRRDLLLEKSFEFEETDLYRRVYVLADQRGIQSPTAVLPDIALKSPKITRKLTTKWFAERVEGRYRSCLARDTRTDL
jgi:hypothetical protein